MSNDKLGCASVRNKGTCNNRLTIARQQLETMVLGALQDHLMNDQLCQEFCKEYTARINEVRMKHNPSIGGFRAELAKLERERQQIIRSIADGVPGSLLKDRAIFVQNRREELQALLDSSQEAPVLFHPNMAERYHKEIRNLIASVNDADMRAEATTILRSLIDKIVLTLREDCNGLSVDLVGDLAGILSIASTHDKLAVTGELSKLQPVNETEDDADQASMADNRDGLDQGDVIGNVGFLESTSSTPRTPNKRDSWGALAMVAGARFELTTFRL